LTPPTFGTNVFYDTAPTDNGTLTIHIPSSATAAYTGAGWINATWNEDYSKWGNNHKAITIVADP
jgi:hypothetical protein